MELRNYADALQRCDEGLRAQPTDKKLQELRASADKQKVGRSTTGNYINNEYN